MYWLDSVILAVLSIGAGLGFWSGLLWQVARVVSLGLALYATLLGNDQVSAFLTTHLFRDSDPRIIQGVAYVGVFLLVYLVVFFVTRLLHRMVKAVHLELLDRLLGAALGLGKMALLVAVACAGLAALALPGTDEWLTKSALAPYFARGTEAGVALLPSEYRTQMADNLLQIRDAVQQKLDDSDRAADEHK